jgi:hypothetical protein
MYSQGLSFYPGLFSITVSLVGPLSHQQLGAASDGLILAGPHQVGHLTPVGGLLLLKRAHLYLDVCLLCSI